MWWCLCGLMLWLGLLWLIVCFFFFFFQAEDGIRDRDVTGVQTCALPISARCGARERCSRAPQRAGSRAGCTRRAGTARRRSEERRVGKECRARGWREQ